ncbi:MAG TPA: YciI family protein [Gemmatimonadaceae bacterium]|nr:YciI family protein [Gemmatimonadaceae bacterium]
MRFMTIYTDVERDTPPSQEEIEAMGNLIGEMSNAGVLIRTDGLQHSKRGARVHITDDGKFSITDGPFTESKEVVGGYAIIEVASKAEAIEWTKRFLKVVGRGTSEIRLMHEQAAFDVDPAQPSLHNTANRA